MKFCFVCGKKTDKLIEGYCEDCYSKKFSLLQVPKELSIKMCSKCGRINYGNIWKEKEIEDILKDKIKVLGKNVDIKISRDDNIHIVAKGLLKNSKKVKEERKDIRLKINKIVCPECSRRLGDYYEAILQLRGDADKAFDFLTDSLGSSVYKVDKVRNGIDIYLIDAHLAGNLSKMLKKRFNARVKKSFKLFTRKHGKDIYRSTFVVRI